MAGEEAGRSEPVERGPIMVDGNEAAASVAHRLSEVIAIYPITPSSPMGELADAWSAQGRTNIWGQVPEVIEMQSEGGAAGVLHGAVQTGALGTTFTASQGLLLMIPNMYKIAGELTPAVIHVAARTVATHALSIFGDHSDVMAVRQTGWAMLCSSSVQEAQDLALVAHAATLASRVPFLHFFDGFRTSHEVNKIEALSDDDLRALLDEDLVRAHRGRALTPDRPVLRGSAQNPDVFFQAREAANPFYLAVPDITQAIMDRLAERTGRRYHLFDYVGHPEAERVVVLMGSAVGAVEETVEALVGRGERVGLVKVRLYRPFSGPALVAALPPTMRAVAVLDRTKEPGAPGEPLYQDVVTALAEEVTAGRARFARLPRIIGGRYGLSSKEFTPAMAAAVFAELEREEPKNHFTVGIVDDVTHTSLPVDGGFSTEGQDTVRAVFYGLGADGTVSANRNAIKIIGQRTPLFAQGYFVYDSKKAGSVTVSHLRFGPRPIRSTYLIDRATFVACHQFHFLERMDVLRVAEPGATFLLNSPYGPDEVWGRLPVEVQQQILDKALRFFVVDASRVARQVGLGGRINTVLQTCFFALANVLPVEEAIAAIKEAIQETYGKLGDVVLEKNFAAVDAALAALHEVKVPGAVAGDLHRLPPVPAEAPDFVQRVTARMIAGEGDLLPVSALPVDGTFPVGTARWERRSIAQEIPIWDPSICIDCAKCALACPHAAIRMKVYDPAALEGAPPGFPSKVWKARDLPGMVMTIQVAPDDCTGCGICVDVCPAKSKEDVSHRSINMEPKAKHLERERANWEFFLTLPPVDRARVRVDTVKGSQMLEPLFEFSGACSGCGETPYLKLLTQMFGDRILVANATGCSSIFGGNLPTTPWSAGPDGRGPAWSNSLFEDNAEFGLGMRLALDRQEAEARRLLEALAARAGEDLARAILEEPQEGEAGIRRQRERVEELKARLGRLDGPEASRLLAVADALVRKSVWIVGGDGWAYDIGFGGLDHVLASGRDVNVLVLDTEVYSNTGGQASKATPRGAVAKFAAAGKDVRKKDLGVIATAYGDVYVAQVAMGADNPQTVKAFAEAEAYRGPSLIIAYSHCIAHGIDMSRGMSHHREAVDSGYWPLYRYDPSRAARGEHPFHLDSKGPSIPLQRFAMKEARFAMLARADPERADRLFRLAQRDVEERWHFYEQMAGIERTVPDRAGGGGRRPREGGGRRRAGGGDGMTVELRTRYLGLDLANPLVPSASPLCSRIDTLRRLRDAGAAAVVLPSLFEEQIEHEAIQLQGLLEWASYSYVEAATYFPELEDYNTGPDAYVRHLELTKQELDIPVIASLNGSTLGGWVKFARRLEDAGADALELNIYFVAANPDLTGEDVEQAYLDLVAAVRAAVRIPLAVKIGPFFSSLANLARRLAHAGADGLVLFNRFLQPDIDLETLSVDPSLHLSTRDELRLPLRWIAILRDRVPVSLAATSGVHTAEDVVKLLLVGADVVMMASALFKHGPEHLGAVLEGVRRWLEDHEYESVEQMKGSMSHARTADPVAFERANYMQALTTYVSPYDWRMTPGSPQA